MHERLKNPRKEQEIKREIIKYLKAKGCLVIPYRNVGIWKKKDKSYIPGPYKGISDILGITREGRFFALEVKRPGNKPTKHQIAFLEAVKSFGCIAGVVRSVKDVISLFKKERG